MLKVKKSAKGLMHIGVEYSWTAAANKLRGKFLQTFEIYAPGIDNEKRNDIQQSSWRELIMLEQV